MDIFPSLSPAWGVVRTPIFGNLVQRGPSGYATSVSQQAYPRYRFKLKFTALKFTPQTITDAVSEDLRSLQGFFNAQQASCKTWLYSARDYNTVQGVALTILTGDDGKKYTPLTFPIGSAKERITDLNGTQKLYANGVLKASPADYTLQTGASSSTWSEPGIVAKWVSAPAAPVTADFAFYYRCRFAKDEQDFEWFLKNYWTATLEFESEFAQ